MSTGRIGGGSARSYDSLPTKTEINRELLRQRCETEDRYTSAAERRTAKARVAREMPVFLHKNGDWLGRARRVETGCSQRRWLSITQGDVAHIVCLDAGRGQPLEAWCGTSVYQTSRRRWGKIRAMATCSACQVDVLTSGEGYADV